MRKDFSKILVERGRIKSKNRQGSEPFNFSFNQNSGWDEESDAKYHNHPISLRKQHILEQNAKQLNENLGPLKRFLQSRVGHKWDNVYSEIRANINPGNAVQAHVLQHLEHYVFTRNQPLSRNSDYFLFIVDEKGFLRSNALVVADYRRQSKPNPTPPEFILGTVTNIPSSRCKQPVYAKLFGVWYKVAWVVNASPGPRDEYYKSNKFDAEFNRIYTSFRYYKGYNHWLPSTFVNSESGISAYHYFYPVFSSLSTKELKNLKIQMNKTK